MDVEDAIKARRSCREYSTKKVKWEDVAKVLNAAIYTPMAGNVFTTRFLVVTDEKKKAKISTYCVNQHFMQEAPYVIVVFSDLGEIKVLYGDLAEDYASKQAAAAVENMLLQATELGLGSCWIGTFDEDPIRGMLMIPEGFKVEAVITLGHAKRKQTMPKKADLNKFVFFDEFDKPEGWKERHKLFWATRETRFEK